MLGGKDLEYDYFRDHGTVGQHADISQNDCSSKVSPYITFGRHKVTDD